MLKFDGSLEERLKSEAFILPYGASRSYGDVGLLSDGVMISTELLKRVISIDSDNKVAHFESGLNFREMESLLNQHGLTLPVRPGTSFLTLGGAIANDIHGKNHHLQGSFGCHLVSITLWRSDAGVIEVSPKQNSELYYATIGGVGLTGIILAAKMKVEAFAGQLVSAENLPFASLEEFSNLSLESTRYEASVAWLVLQGKRAGQGIFTRGNSVPNSKESAPGIDLTFPPLIGNGVINPMTTRLFNRMYFASQMRDLRKEVSSADFYYPLDRIKHWNRGYGSRGFHQYQCVLPERRAQEGMEEIVDYLKRAGGSSFLTVLKTFGSRDSGGLLSFPMEGWTLAVDFFNRGAASESIFKRLDALVLKYAGRLYLAKDSRMSREMFESTYSRIGEFKNLRDPRFSSDLAKRLLN